MTSSTWIRPIAAAMLAFSAGAAFPGQAPTRESNAATTAANANPKPMQIQPRPSGIDGRVQLLSKELDLDANQQVQVRKILVQHQAELSRAWSDESMPAAMRVAATRAIGDKTAGRIRGILTDKQREKYLKSQPSLSDNAQPATKVESWIDAVGNK